MRIKTITIFTTYDVKLKQTRSREIIYFAPMFENYTFKLLT